MQHDFERGHVGVGARDGFFSFAAEKRGAIRVMATIRQLNPVEPVDSLSHRRIGDFSTKGKRNDSVRLRRDETLPSLLVPFNSNARPMLQLGPLLFANCKVLLEEIMKKLIFVVALFCFAVPSHAQNWATVSGSNITDLNQRPLAAGQICFLVTDQNNRPISVSIGGGGPTLRRPYCSAVSNGAIAAFTVPNPASTSPAGIYYRVTVKDTSTGQEALRYPLVRFSGATFNFDNYAPTKLGSFAPLSGNSLSGDLSVSGNVAASGTVSADAFTATASVSAPEDLIAGSVEFSETTAPACAAGFDFLWGDSSAHRIKECDNGNSPYAINPVYNVQSYGAVGDFSNDDTSAINAAITAAAAVNGVVYVPATANAYKIVPATSVTGSSTFLGALPIQSNMHVVCERGATLKIADGVSTDASPQRMAMFYSLSFTSNWSIEGCSLDMNGDNNPISPSRPATYNLYNQSQVWINGLSGFADDVRIENNEFINNPGTNELVMASGFTGSEIPLSHRWIVAHNLFKHNGFDTSDNTAVFGYADGVSVHDNIFWETPTGQLVRLVLRLHMNSTALIKPSTTTRFTITIGEHLSPITS